MIIYTERKLKINIIIFNGSNFYYMKKKLADELVADQNTQLITR